MVCLYGPLVGGPNTEGIQRLKLVRRPTERDIFWDETTGESLDPSCLLDPKSLPHLCEEREEKRIQQTGRRVLSSWTNEGEMLSVDDRGKTRRSGRMGPESARSSQTGRIRGARGIWDHKLD